LIEIGISFDDLFVRDSGNVRVRSNGDRTAGE